MEEITENPDHEKTRPHVFIGGRSGPVCFFSRRVEASSGLGAGGAFSQKGSNLPPSMQRLFVFVFAFESVGVCAGDRKPFLSVRLLALVYCFFVGLGTCTTVCTGSGDLLIDLTSIFSSIFLCYVHPKNTPYDITGDHSK